MLGLSPSKRLRASLFFHPLSLLHFPQLQDPSQMQEEDADDFTVDARHYSPVQYVEGNRAAGFNHLLSDLIHSSKARTIRARESTAPPCLAVTTKCHIGRCA